MDTNPENSGAFVEQKPISITVPPTATPSFSNATQVTVSDDSVVIQFAYVRPDMAQGQLISEIVLSPKHAIDFSRALDATIKKHFTRHLADS
jgi:Protein of unknown function (DUF3467)